ncbi:hypothetical protein U1Q18_050787 [Sarracenia purpurea var. burkii]
MRGYHTLIKDLRSRGVETIVALRPDICQRNRRVWSRVVDKLGAYEAPRGVNFEYWTEFNALLSQYCPTETGTREAATGDDIKAAESLMSSLNWVFFLNLLWWHSKLAGRNCGVKNSQSWWISQKLTNVNYVLNPIEFGGTLNINFAGNFISGLIGINNGMNIYLAHIFLTYEYIIYQARLTVKTTKAVKSLPKAFWLAAKFAEAASNGSIETAANKAEFANSDDIKIAEDDFNKIVKKFIEDYRTTGGKPAMEEKSEPITSITLIISTSSNFPVCFTQIEEKTR